ncbi:MAG: EMC3/TMCO1 family protein [archaeon]
MNKEGKEGSFKLIFIIMIVSLAIASLWNNFSIIKETAHLALDPSVGILLEWDLTIGMLIIIFIIALVIVLFQKYTTDQETLRELKKEQKLLQEEMKKYKSHPEKLLEIQKKQLEIIPKTMQLTMRPLIFTSIPLILFFRWFHDFFNAAGNPKFFGFLHWLWFYIIASIIFNSLLRKILKVV